jgi:hypothetical protein
MEICKVLSNRLQIAQTKLLFIGKVIITQSNGGTNDFAVMDYTFCVRSVMYSSLIIFQTCYLFENILISYF